MFIEIKTLRFRNLLSYGNNTTEINFQSGMTLISAKSGSGKSAILDALSFCFFGKPYRKIKINELINRKNKKKLFSECEFVIDGVPHKITRTLAPSEIKIERDGKDIELLSSKKLNQEEINKMLGVDHNLFRQIIALAINHNKAFLSLDIGEKRDIVESIFNIKIFAEMLKKLKTTLSVLKLQNQINLNNYGIYESSLKSITVQLESIRRNKETFQSNHDAEIVSLDTEIKSLVGQYEVIRDANKTLENNLEDAQAKLVSKDYSAIIAEIDSNIKLEDKTIKSYETQVAILNKSDMCPICRTVVTPEHKASETKRVEDEIAVSRKKISELSHSLKAEREALKEQEVLKKKITETKNSLSVNKNNIKLIKANIQSLLTRKKIKESETFDFDDSALLQENDRITKLFDETKVNLLTTSEEIKYSEHGLNILSDQGIKSFFFKKLVPILNSRINHYVDLFDLPIQINFNDCMEETINVIGETNPVSYTSFSEGEKKRIDIAIMLSFIETTKIASNWNCNILMLDEIFDSSVDGDGLDKIMGAIKQMTIDDSKLCCYCISHRDNDHENYTRKLLIKKSNGFSTIQ